MIGLIVFISYWYNFSNKRYKQSLFILFLQVTGCFQIIPVSLMNLPPIITKPYDWVSLIILITLVLEYKNIKFNKHLTLAVRVYLSFMILLAFYSIFALHIEVKVVLSVFRIYLFFVAPILFMRYDYQVIRQVISWIAILITICCVAFIFQAISGKAILSALQTDVVITKEKVGAFSRFYNLPYFTIFVLIYYVRRVLTQFDFKLLVFAFIVFTAIVLSFNRNSLVAAIIAIVATFFHNRKFKFTDLAALALFGWALLFVISQLQSKRLNQGFSDLQGFSNSISLNDVESNSDVGALSTSQFRALHFYERFAYVTDKGLKTSLFGIGMVNENANSVRKLDFLIGLVNDKNRTTQVDTSDIVWSLLLLQTGLLGMALFIWVFVKYIAFFFKNRKSAIAYMSGIYAVALLLTSFFNIEIIFAPVILFISMMYVLTNKVNNSILSSKSNSSATNLNPVISNLKQAEL